MNGPTEPPDPGASRDGASRGGTSGSSEAEQPVDVQRLRREARDRDHALIRAAQEGEEAAFAELVTLHQARAIRVARNLVPTDDDALDLSQEAFLRVFKSLDRFDFGHDFTTWLYRIVTNLCIDFLRKRRTAISVSRGHEGDGGEEVAFDLEDPRAAAPSDQAEALETAAEVQAVLATLAPHFQSVLTLREIEGLPCPEIAEIVGATHVTVRWRLHRGRKLFQEEWERRARLRQQGASQLLGDTNVLDPEGASVDQDENLPSSGVGTPTATRAPRTGQGPDGAGTRP